MSEGTQEGEVPVRPMTPPPGSDVPDDVVRDLTTRIEALERALDSRTTIGQAIGIWMHRFSLTDTQAFEYLKKVSQHSQVKLRDIAKRLVAQANGSASRSQADEGRDALKKQHDEIEARLDELKVTSGRKQASTAESVERSTELREG